MTTTTGSASCWSDQAWPDLLDGALAQPRRYAASAPAVLARLTLVLREVAWRVHTADDRQAVRELHRLRETIADADFGTAEKAELGPAGHARRARPDRPLVTWPA